MTTQSGKVKAAVVREEGYPIGQPAPCYINCECGKRPGVKADDEPIWCECGICYDSRGWIIGRF